MNAPVTDRMDRPLRDLRISLTDRCNFRCSYCMPKALFGADHAFMPRSELLTFEEITRIAGVFTRLGVRKLRLTGGEPLIRRDLEVLLGMLADVPGIEDISLTTNASLLTLDKAQALKAAGLNRITVSLDGIDDATFRAMNDVGFPVAKVLQGIDNAEQAGLSPIKINMVVQRGVNDHDIVAMAEHFRGTPHIVRFIEYMDVGNSNGWRLDQVVPSKEVVERINAQWPIEPVAPNYRGEVAERYRYTDGAGEIGMISSVSQPFCGDCSRARLSAEGKLFTCLFASAGHEVRDRMRAGESDEALRDYLAGIWTRRADRYSELRTHETKPIDSRKIEMSYIGG
ncbi:MAG: GTP 3',8-cyclase MoaA [Spiribacter salinus]|uniref:GTP 3',8-cyclase n=1 Tax=Spiribacter salinus TaxID=1335746 RepID=A0A540VQ33_9GAMM|nr:GTP 3',8-cyclase MoaA [Spiribacter sp.]TQE98872.1 MAG: GTP 3',8-cyclase MoaA [Spiribacter salinus]